jgi:hypothetical protein
VRVKNSPPPGYPCQRPRALVAHSRHPPPAITGAESVCIAVRTSIPGNDDGDDDGNDNSNEDGDLRDNYYRNSNYYECYYSSTDYSE